VELAHLRNTWAQGVDDCSVFLRIDLRGQLKLRRQLLPGNLWGEGAASLNGVIELHMSLAVDLD